MGIKLTDENTQFHKNPLLTSNRLIQTIFKPTINYGAANGNFDKSNPKKRFTYIHLLEFKIKDNLINNVNSDIETVLKGISKDILIAIRDTLSSNPKKLNTVLNSLISKK